MTDGHQIALMRTILTRWGAICELSRNWNGYPSSDTTYRAAFGRGGNEKRLPIPNIPSFAVQTSEAVMKLPDDEGNAITIWYAHHHNAEGVWLESKDKALILGIDLRSLRYRVSTGRKLLLISAPHIIDTWQAWEDSRMDRAIEGLRAIA